MSQERKPTHISRGGENEPQQGHSEGFYISPLTGQRYSPPTVNRPDRTT